MSNMRLGWLVALFTSTVFSSCVIDNSGPLGSDDDDVADDDDSAAAEDDDAADENGVCPGSFVRYVDVWYRDVDGDGCLSRSERDDPNSDQWVSVAVCGDGTFSTTWSEGDVAPGLPSAPFLNSNDPSTWCSEEDGDDDVAGDDDASGDDDSDADDDDVAGDDDSDADDDDEVSDDDDANVVVSRSGFSGTWDLRVYNWDASDGSWWGITSPGYCAIGAGSSLGCNLAIASGQRISVNGVIIDAGGYLVTGAPSDSISKIEIGGVEYDLVRTRSSSLASGPWDDIDPGECRYGATGNNDFWCQPL